MEKIIPTIDKIKFMNNIGEGRSTIQRLNALEDIWPGKDLDQSYLENFTNLAQNKYDMPLYYELILEAQTFLKKRVYHTLIILAETTFEVYIEKLLRNIFRCEGKSDSKIDELLCYNGSFGNHNNRLNHLDKKLIKDFGSKNRFVDSIEFKNWSNDLYVVRNDIVHRGMVHEITFEKCLKAIKAAKEAISFFEKRIDSFANDIQICTDVSFLENSAGRISAIF